MYLLKFFLFGCLLFPADIPASSEEGFGSST